MKTIKAIFLALAVSVGVVAATSMPSHAAAQRPAVVATSATDCSQSAFLGTRVCVDKTTPSGAIAYVYTSGTGLYTTFSVTVVNVPGAWTATPIEYQVGAVRNTSGIVYAALVANAYCIENPCAPQIASGANQNLMDWFANDSSYEFVLTN